MTVEIAPTEEWLAQEAVLPERAVEALARYNHDLNNDHGWYDPECLRYPENHREPYARLYARAALAAVMAAGFEIIPVRLDKR